MIEYIECPTSLNEFKELINSYQNDEEIILCYHCFNWRSLDKIPITSTNASDRLVEIGRIRSDPAYASDPRYNGDNLCVKAKSIMSDYLLKYKDDTSNKLIIITMDETHYDISKKDIHRYREIVDYFRTKDAYLSFPSFVHIRNSNILSYRSGYNETFIKSWLTSIGDKDVFESLKNDTRIGFYNLNHTISI